MSGGNTGFLTQNKPAPNNGNGHSDINRGIRAAWAQINPFDGNRTWDTTQRGVAPTNPTPKAPGNTGGAPAPQSETPPGNVLGSSTRGSGGGGSADSDPVLAAFYGDQVGALRALLGMTDNTVNQGRASVNDSYNRGVSRLNGDQSRILRDLTIRRQESSDDKRDRLGDLDDDMMRRSEGLKRMFAQRGAGVSGAAQLLAPAALGGEFSEQRGDVVETFGRNARRLKLTEDDANAQHRRGVEDLGLKKNESLRGLESGANEQRLSLLDALREAEVNRIRAAGGGANEARAALAPYTDQSNRIRAALTALFDQYRSPVLEAAPINVAVPELEGYTVDPVEQQLIESGQAEPMDEGLLPYFPFLRRQSEYGMA